MHVFDNKHIKYKFPCYWNISLLIKMIDDNLKKCNLRINEVDCNKWIRVYDIYLTFGSFP